MTANSFRISHSRIGLCSQLSTNSYLHIDSSSARAVATIISPATGSSFDDVAVRCS
jgi:hypothetical protein